MEERAVGGAPKFRGKRSSSVEGGVVKRNKTLFILNVILIHATPIVFLLMILVVPRSLVVPTLVSGLFWLAMFILLFYTEQNRHRISLWCITSLLGSLILANPGMLAMISWTISGFAP